MNWIVLIACFETTHSLEINSRIWLSDKLNDIVVTSVLDKITYQTGFLGRNSKLDQVDNFFCYMISIFMVFGRGVSFTEVLEFLEGVAHLYECETGIRASNTIYNSQVKN